MSTNRCTVCNLDLRAMPLRIQFSAHTREQARDVHCPACGQPIRLSIGDFGVFFRDSERGPTYATWDTGSAARTGTMSVGALAVVFQPMAPVAPSSICFPFALLLRGEAGLVAPSLPVRPEFFDVIDLEAVRRKLAAGQSLTTLSGNMLRAELPLRGLPNGSATVELPIHAERMEEVNLRIWPRPISGWTRYLFGTSATGERGAATLASGDLALDCRTVEGKWSAPATAQNHGASLTGVVEGMPEWLCLRSGKNQSGGLFAVPRPVELSRTGALTFGMDFGTSNTCVAYRDPTNNDEVSTIPAVPEDKMNAYVVRAGSDVTWRRGHDFWPSGRGTGVSKDLFPSEIVLPVQRNGFAQHCTKLETWKYGIDFGLSTPGIEFAGGYEEASRLVTEFKWVTSLATNLSGLEGYVEGLQAAYLEAVLAQSIVRHAIKTQSLPATATLLLSYPLAFQDGDRKTLQAAAGRACRALSDYTGVSWRHQFGVDEAEAAAIASGAQPGTALRLYVDMGGGTTDIALIWNYLDAKGKMIPRRLALTSVRFAGTTLFRGWVGDAGRPETACVPATKAAQLPRRLREATNPMTVFQDKEIFLPQFSKIVAGRAGTFYEHIVEYLARLVAAALIDGEVVDATGALPEDLPLEVYFFGNGWQLATACHPAWERTLSFGIESRVIELLAAEPAAATVHDSRGRHPRDVKLNLQLQKLVTSVPHPKAAVAFGLLSPDGANAREGGYRRGIVGWPLMVGDRTVPWYLPYDLADGHNLFTIRARLAARPQSTPEPPARGTGPATGEPVRFRRGGQTREGRVAGREADRIRVEVPAPAGQREEVDLSALRIVGTAAPVDDLFDSPPSDLFPAEPSIAVGALVEYERGEVSRRGTVDAVRGSRASIAITAALVWISTSDVVDGQVAAQTPRGGAASWDRQVPPALTNDVVLRIPAEALPPMGSSYKTPFDLDPSPHPGGASLPNRGAHVRRQCAGEKGSWANNWLAQGVFESLLEEVSAKLLYRVT